MPTTAAFVREYLIGVSALDVHVAEHNIRMSARYLKWLVDRARGDERLALAAYYQGPRSVDLRGVLPETVASTSPDPPVASRVTRRETLSRAGRNAPLSVLSPAVVLVESADCP